jgi:hypothetical protein
VLCDYSRDVGTRRPVLSTAGIVCSTEVSERRNALRYLYIHVGRGVGDYICSQDSWHKPLYWYFLAGLGLWSLMHVMNGRCAWAFAQGFCDGLVVCLGLSI